MGLNKLKHYWSRSLLRLQFQTAAILSGVKDKCFTWGTTHS